MRADVIVYVIDADPLVRRGMELVLALDGIPTTPFEGVASFMEALPKLKEGIIIVDAFTSGFGGVELVRMLPALDRSDSVIVLVAAGDVSTAVEALKAGACDCLERPLQAIRLASSVRACRDRLKSSSDTEMRLATLSRREREVLRHIVRGLTSKRTAIELGISPRTVETHRQHLMEKTGTSSLSQLVCFGVRAGLEEEELAMTSSRPLACKGSPH